MERLASLLCGGEVEFAPFKPNSVDFRQVVKVQEGGVDVSEYIDFLEKPSFLVGQHFLPVLSHELDHSVPLLQVRKVNFEE